MINVNSIQEMIKEVYGYKEPKKNYNFYYDETNNYRKVELDIGGFNDNRVLNNNFTLGGICIEKNKNVDTSELLKKLKLQKNQELKSRVFFKKMNAFEECICHKKLSFILDWILDNAYIHYSDIDIFYYTVIDIVDSVCDTQIGKMIPEDLINAFKSELYCLLRENIILFLSICIDINYPNISSEDIKFFCDSIIYMIDTMDEEMKERIFTLELFKSFLKEKRDCDELVFLKGNKEKTIMESFYSLRQERCITFSNSYHIFDNEIYDEETMKNEKMLLDNGEILNNYQFKDSKSEMKIQISDIIVYLISKYLKFLTYNSSEYIDETIKNMNETGRENISKLIQLIDKSDTENHFFISTITAEQVNFVRKTMHEHIQFLIDNK